MESSQFVKNIDFLFYKPNHATRMFGIVAKYLLPFGLSLETINTRLPEKEKETKALLKSLGNIPRMSTIAVGAMINRAVAELPEGACFVNIGVWHGFSFLSGLVGNSGKKCIGVDNFSQFGGPKNEFMSRFEEFGGKNHFFYDVDYCEYFDNIHQDPIGLYMYDGEHSYDNQLKGLRVAEKYFNDHCIILVDDTNWSDPRSATLDFIKTSANNYEILLDVTTAKKSHPTFWNGIMVFKKLS